MRKIALVLTLALAIGPVDGQTRRRIVAPHVPEPPFGVFINLTSQSQPAQVASALDLAAADGIKWVRVQFTWSAIQPTSAPFANLRFYDPLVTRAVQDNLQILGLLAYATQWNTTAPVWETRPAQREHYPPADYTAWSSFVTFIVGTYKNRIHSWEIWNEPDLGFPPPDEAHPCNGFWCGTPAQYARLLSVSFKAIKAADPSATVLLGGLSIAGSEDRNFLYDILLDPENPASESFDVLSFHSYGSKGEALSRIQSLRVQTAYAGAEPRPIWITEFGYGSDPAVQNLAAYIGGEAGQAAYVRDIAPYLLSLGVRKVFWFQLYDGDPTLSAADPFASYGLLTFGLAKKQAYGAYGDLIKSYRP
jgi:cellulase (glycosyl hydrolase family 5)